MDRTLINPNALMYPSTLLYELMIGRSNKTTMPDEAVIQVEQISPNQLVYSDLVKIIRPAWFAPSCWMVVTAVNRSSKKHTDIQTNV